tara:strand:- start:215 stop:421 length:207 start_codon:yes stop_codon:yes gene_type:complete
MEGTEVIYKIVPHPEDSQLKDYTSIDVIISDEHINLSDDCVIDISSKDVEDLLKKPNLFPFERGGIKE